MVGFMGIFVFTLAASYLTKFYGEISPFTFVSICDFITIAFLIVMKVTGLFKTREELGIRTPPRSPTKFEKPESQAEIEMEL